MKLDGAGHRPPIQTFEEAFPNYVSHVPLLIPIIERAQKDLRNTKKEVKRRIRYHNVEVFNQTL